MPTTTTTSSTQQPQIRYPLSPAVPAAPGDADRIAEIHMAAFGSNAMLLAQFPTPAARRGLRESIRVKALADIADPKISVLVVRHDSSSSSSKEGVINTSGSSTTTTTTAGNNGSGNGGKGQVVAFAKWSHPLTRQEEEEYKETEWIWPQGTDINLLNAWGDVMEDAERRFMGDEGGFSTPFYRLSFMGTDPSFERRGAASKLVRWGIDRCNAEGVPAYLEGTLTAAAFYEKMGFRALDRISLKCDSGDENGEWVYEEIAFRYDPA